MVCSGTFLAPAPADTWLQRLCPSRQSRFLLCAETALVYFLVVVVLRGTLGWTGQPAPVCRCPDRGIHATSRVIARPTSAPWQISTGRFCNCMNNRQRNPYDCAATLCHYALSTRCFFTCCSAVTFVIHLVNSHIIHGSDQFFLPRHSQDDTSSLYHNAGCFKLTGFVHGINLAARSATDSTSSVIRAGG